MKRLYPILSVLNTLILAVILTAGWTYTFKVNTPAGSDDPREADDRMREIKGAVQERFDIDHYMTTSASNTYDAADAGKHRYITFVEPNSISTVDANEAILHTIEVSGNPELAWIDEDEARCQLTSGGALYIDSNATYAADCFDDPNAFYTGVITTDAILDANITSSDFEPNCVNTAAIADANVTVGKMADGACWITDGTLVKDGYSLGNDWEDLDLSEVVGARSALVMIRVRETGGTNEDVWFRTNGITTKPDDASGHGGLNTMHLQASKHNCTFVATDSSGVIEWYSDVGTATLDLTVVGYFK